jgi:hypothetical protein
MPTGPVDEFDSPPIRPGVTPVLDVDAARLTAQGGLDPGYMRLTRGMVQHLRYHFTGPAGGPAPRVEFPNVADRVWTGDDATSTIWIGSLAEWKPSKESMRPALLVDRLAQQVSTRTIGDAYHGVRQGWHWDLMEGMHVVHCVGAKEGEAEWLAAEVLRELKMFSNEIREAMCLMRFLPVKLDRRTQLDEHQEHYSVPVVCMYGYEHSWRATPVDEAEITTIRSLYGSLPPG